MRQPHEVLGVAENATPEEVAEAYRRLMLYSDPADERLRKEIEQAKNETDSQREVAEEARRTVIDDTRQPTATSQPIDPIAPPQPPVVIRIASYLFFLSCICGVIATIWLLFSGEWPLVLIGIGMMIGIPIIGPFVMEWKFRYIFGVTAVILLLFFLFSWDWLTLLGFLLSQIGMIAMIGCLAIAAIRLAFLPTTIPNRQANIPSLFFRLCGTWFVLSAWSTYAIRIAQTYAQDHASPETNPIAFAIWAFAAATSVLSFAAATAHLAPLEYSNDKSSLLSVTALAYIEVAMIIALIFGVFSITYIVTGIFFIVTMLKLMRE